MKNEAYITVVSHLSTAADLIRMAGIEVGHDPVDPFVPGKPDPDGVGALCGDIYQTVLADMEKVKAALPPAALEELAQCGAAQKQRLSNMAEMSPEELRKGDA